MVCELPEIDTFKKLADVKGFTTVAVVYANVTANLPLL